MKSPLGKGTDGAVYRSQRDTAIKALYQENLYWNEVDSYRRLAEYGMTQQIDQFRVPRLLGSDDALLVIEMDIIQHPPFIIDFAKVRIDRPPDFSKEVTREHNRQCKEWFGDHWPEVRSLLAALESVGIYYLDPRPGNIVFEDLR